MSIKQISVFLENRPGTLKKLTSVLAKNNIDMRATSLAETKDFGIARIIVDDAYEAVNTLKENDFVASLTSVLGVEIPDEAGGLDKLLDYFAEADVNIEYMYAFAGKKNAYMIFRVNDTKNAEAALRKAGGIPLSAEEMSAV
jgi:hypothetical protein